LRNGRGVLCAMFGRYFLKINYYRFNKHTPVTAQSTLPLS
jgi:hypothetical protein